MADLFVRSAVAPQSKRTAVAMEYTYLLTSQLESQRQFWEHQLQVKKKKKKMASVTRKPQSLYLNTRVSRAGGGESER